MIRALHPFHIRGFSIIGHEHYLLFAPYIRQQEDMKEEELDWRIYHVLAENPGMDERSLAGLLQVSPEGIHESFLRLQKSLLIEVLPGGARVLSIPEMILQCQARYDTKCPFSFEGGLIRVKSGQERKDD